ncbi:copper resistance system multicopper oxidase [Oceanidesulfovibrio marinus]|uniref:Copper resistance system multicopper oxidase n=1 Tax=Oceanidesulfovibrio marinus TaxID=370038 RepID=A0ABX6NDL7_9BACT|nr:copper resistance system multicopper oxidase [Oceanidesulfovibrio marinus]QJT07850.1 copper resistance system multicopper oxidase [Oceanidesulfovibrio marinus]
MSGCKDLSRRSFIKKTGIFLAGMQCVWPLPAWALSTSPGIEQRSPKSSYDLTIGYSPITIDGREGVSTGVNGSVPGPLVYLREGDDVTLRVTNELMDTKHASIHWHGILVPANMDGVPGVSYRGIPPGETYVYRYRVKQAGTYWYHSHSRFQEQTGTYGPLVILPKDGEPFTYDRDYPVVLSDWSFEDPEAIFRHINILGDYYNYQRRTVADFFKDVREMGLLDTIAERNAWGNMRMSPVDLADVTGHTYTFLMNGHSAGMNWTALFNPGETIRLRFINSSTMTNFDVRIPGLDMEVVMADGKAVKPVSVHEFRIGVAETYDVLVRPSKDQAFNIFAESLDRSGYTRGTLAPRAGMHVPPPALRPRPVRQLEKIGMGGMDDNIFGVMMGDMKHGDMQMDGQGKQPKQPDPRIPGPNGPEPFKPDDIGVNVIMVVNNPRYRLDEPGIGLGEDGWRVLVYDDLVSAEPQPYSTTVDREMTINITANMERYMFSFDGRKFTEQPGPYFFRHNERLRLFLVNHTMMEHPIHLHGMWMQMENGADKLPFKHTILTKPGGVVSALITPIERGDWAFHCHLLYHMEAGMFQVVRVA